MRKPEPKYPIDPVVQRRLDALERLIDAEYGGSPALFEQRTGIKMAQVNQWFSGYRALRDKALRRLEAVTRKPEGWFDALEVALEALTQAPLETAPFIIDCTRQPDPQSLPQWVRNARSQNDNYTPDFMVQGENGEIVYIEVKGHQEIARLYDRLEKEHPDQFLVVGPWRRDFSNLRGMARRIGEYLLENSLIFESARAERGATAGTQDKGPLEGPTIGGHVPLISSVQAGAFKEHVDNFHPGDGGMELIATTVPVKRFTFALRVSGDSMEPEFPEGMILIIEPELEPNPGDFVVAKNGSDETTFKQLIRDGGDWYLKPVNPRYPIKPLGDSSIIGVLRAVERRYR